MIAELVKLITSDHLVHYGALYPAQGTHPSAVAVLMIHGMTGSFVGEIESAVPPFLAEAGYTVLVPNNRGNGIKGAATEMFSGCIADIVAAIDLLEERGFKKIILYGHSKGGVKVAYYMANRQDPRVAALGVLSPAGNVHEIAQSLAKQFGRRNPEAFMTRAVKLAQKGAGERMYAHSDWPFIVSAGTLSEHGQTTGDEVLENLPKVKLPILAVCGGLEVDWCYTVTTLRQNPPEGYRVEVVDGADHVYTGHEKDLADLMVDWMKSL